MAVFESNGPVASPTLSGSGAATPSPVVIPDHQLVRCIGRGSYGEVWLARNSIGTYRAVKVLRRQSFRDQRPFDRELSGIRSFEPVSRSHEGFVDILQVGINEAQGYFYYIMEIGDDQELQQQIRPETYTPKTLAAELSRRGKLPVQECLQLGLSLSDALANLHHHGLVHRDVKPSNIIFVGGIPKLADIGLVSAVDTARSYVGTEGFIPPEGPGTPQADIYSLGKLLYEACTGKDRQEFPNLPPGFDTAPGRKDFLELNEIILLACQLDVAKRYRSADQMHSDLLLIAAGKSVRRLRLLERRFASLKRGAVFSFAAMALAGLLLYPIYDHWREAAASRQRQVGAQIAYGTRAVESGDLLGALPYFVEALQLDQDNGWHEAQHRLRVGSVLTQSPKLVQMWFATQQVDEVEFSRDGSKVLVVESFGRARVFDLATGNPVSPPFGQPTFHWRGSLSPEADRAVLGGEDKTATVWRLSDGQEILRLEHPDKVYSARFSPDSRRIITGCRDKLGRVWDAHSGRLELKLAGHEDALLFGAFSPDGQTIVTTSKDFTARLWDAGDGHSLGQPLRHSSWVYYASFGPNSELVTAGFDHQARLWNLQTSQEILPRLPHRDGVKSAEFSPDGRLILTASLDGTVHLWSRTTHLPWDRAPLLRHSSRVTEARFSPEGARVVACGVDGTVRVWDLSGAVPIKSSFRGNFCGDKSRYLVRSGSAFQVRDSYSQEPISKPLDLEGTFRHAMLSPRGTFLLAYSDPEPGTTQPSRVKVWECSSGLEITPVLRTTRPVRAFEVTANRKSLVMAGAQTLEAWNLQQGFLLWSQQFQAPVEGLAVNRAGTSVAVRTGNEVRCWEIANGHERFVPIRHEYQIKNVEFSPNNQWLLTCDAENGFAACEARVWNAISGKPIGSPLRHSDGVVQACFSPDGSRVLTASEDFTARIWDVATGKPLGPPMPHRDKVLAASYSPDGKWIVTAAADGSARVWSAETSDPLTPPFRHNVALVDAAFLHDGKSILTLDLEGDARVFNLNFCEHSAHDLADISRLLSGDPARPGTPGAGSSESLSNAWQLATTRYIADFTPSSDQLVAWHEAQAMESERDEDWFAAAYHLKCLVNLRPQDETSRGWLQSVQRHLAPEQ